MYDNISTLIKFIETDDYPEDYCITCDNPNHLLFKRFIGSLGEKYCIERKNSNSHANEYFVLKRFIHNLQYVISAKLSLITAPHYKENISGSLKFATDTIVESAISRRLIKNGVSVLFESIKAYQTNTLHPLYRKAMIRQYDSYISSPSKAMFCFRLIYRPFAQDNKLLLLSKECRFIGACINTTKDIHDKRLNITTIINRRQQLQEAFNRMDDLRKSFFVPEEDSRDEIYYQIMLSYHMLIITLKAEVSLEESKLIVQSITRYLDNKRFTTYKNALQNKLFAIQKRCFQSIYYRDEGLINAYCAEIKRGYSQKKWIKLLQDILKKESSSQLMPELYHPDILLRDDILKEWPAKAQIDIKKCATLNILCMKSVSTENRVLILNTRKFLRRDPAYVYRVFEYFDITKKKQLIDNLKNQGMGGANITIELQRMLKSGLKKSRKNAKELTKKTKDIMLEIEKLKKNMEDSDITRTEYWNYNKEIRDLEAQLSPLSFRRGAGGEA